MNQIFSFWGEDFVSLLNAEIKWKKIYKKSGRRSGQLFF